MQEEKIFIKNGSLMIEALLFKASEKEGVVICHPHSLMGGSMYNNVVEAIQEAYAAQNISTLRFNFRGVGGSTGSYDEGNGEQKDILAVCEYLNKSGFTELIFAGYSFGGWVGSNILKTDNNPFSYSILVSPPIEYFSFDWSDLRNQIRLMICGDADQFCSLDTLVEEAKKINSPLEIIHGADHFYRGKEMEFKRIFQKYMIK
jgi:alpha/beta superfamily hydrolase